MCVCVLQHNTPSTVNMKARHALYLFAPLIWSYAAEDEIAIKFPFVWSYLMKEAPQVAARPQSSGRAAFNEGARERVRRVRAAAPLALREADVR